jgi:hypothetical protein
VNVFLDSSALAKRYVQEHGSARVDALLATASSLGVSVLGPPEVVSAFCRRRREGRLTRAQYAKARDALFADVGDASVIALTDHVIGRTVGILERWSVRASDALHIACAAEWSCDLFVSADTQQGKVARAYGLRVEQLPAG